MTSAANHWELPVRRRWTDRLAAAWALPLAFVAGNVALCLAVFFPIAVFSAACGGDSSPVTTTASTSRSSSAPPSTTGPPAVTDESTGANASINPRAPLAQTVDAGFDPPFTVRIPAHWTAVLRDISAFQVYAGNEDFEITFDHTYRSKESVPHAISRLLRTDGLTAGRLTNAVIGDRKGKGFVARSESAVSFVDSGFHTNQGSRLEIFAIPAKDGTTVTVFLTAEGNPTHGLDALGPLARRIFKTVAWQ